MISTHIHLLTLKLQNPLESHESNTPKCLTLAICIIGIQNKLVMTLDQVILTNK